VEVGQWQMREGALGTAEGTEQGDVLRDYLWTFKGGLQVAARLFMFSTSVPESSTKLYIVATNALSG